MRLLLAYSLLVTATVGFASEPRTLVDLGYAKYEGFLNETTGNINFLGIRYAAAPTGDRRWREPQPPQPTSGILQAKRHPNRCWQSLEPQPISRKKRASSSFIPASQDFGVAEGRQQILVPSPKSAQGQQTQLVSRHSNQEIPDDAPPRSEDCLFLNIATPANGSGSLPVVVYIHGGAYVAGGAYQFNGEDLVTHAGGNAVVVIIQYRIGVFGFLSSQKIYNGGALNAGLLDQQFALQWVQDHITKFGGDPAKVTIWGKSCGAGSVIQHLIAHNGNTQPKLFRAAIVSSPFLTPQYAYNHWIPETAFKWVLQKTNCTNAPDALVCLRTVDAGVLNEVNIDVTLDRVSRIFYPLPVIDGTFITDRPSVLLRKEHINTDTVLTVINRNESGLWSLGGPAAAGTVNIMDYISYLWPELTRNQADMAADLYRDLGTPVDQAFAIKSESIFICPSYSLLRALKGKGYMGLFAVPPAWHADDFIYYWNTSLVAGKSSEPFDNAEFKDNFAQSFLNFAIYLNPNKKWSSSNTLPLWPQWNEDGHAEMVFNKTEVDQPLFEVVPTANDLIRRCEFWETVGPNTWQ